MEHRFLTILTTLVLLTTLLGCKSEDPNPELKDPIYSDLKKRTEEAEKAAASSKAEIEALELALSKSAPITLEKKNIEKDLQKTRREYSRASQEQRYFRIRMERRQVEDKINYRRALASEKPWPDPEEYKKYLKNIELRQINRNWNARVPKLQDRLESYKVPKATAVPRGTENEEE